jgi:hypothetical protein
MRITINDLISRVQSWERVKELFNGRESVTAKDIAAATIIPLQGRAWLLSHLLGPRDVKREVARRIARDVLGDRDIPQAYRVWLDTGDEALRQAIWVAAWFGADKAAGVVTWSPTVAAWFGLDKAAGVTTLSATVAATLVDAGVVAWSVARSVARDKYIGWMAEWLDNHE